MLDKSHSVMLEYSHSKRHGEQPKRLQVCERRKAHMSTKFFELPESTKRAIWTALLARWAAKKPATR